VAIPIGVELVPLSSIPSPRAPPTRLLSLVVLLSHLLFRLLFDIDHWFAVAFPPLLSLVYIAFPPRSNTYCLLRFRLLLNDRVSLLRNIVFVIFLFD